MLLEKYKAKRDFQRTPEPKPGRGRKRDDALRFVVQKHSASRLHFDFRLEAGIALKSWAVPKGPSLNPAHKRLAMKVEDHPLEYFDFEGVIPEGEYGAGEVIVWDQGVYVPFVNDLPILDRKAAEKAVFSGIRDGKLSFQLQGQRLSGRWALAQKEADAWLLIKKADEYSDTDSDVLDHSTSVISSRTLEDLKRNPGSAKKWSSAAPARISLEPMLATLTDSPFSGPEWVFEPKLDGMRILAVIAGSSVDLYSRRGLTATHLFPGIVRQIQLRSVGDMILDGEVVALDSKGEPSFQLLQKRINLTREIDVLHAERAIPVRYYLFDILSLAGKDLRRLPLYQRRALLEVHAPVGGMIDLVAQFPEFGERAYAAAVSHGFEGVIAKRKDSGYEPRRSRKWLKVKAEKEDEFVIGGYTAGRGRRGSAFGSLLVGQYDESGALRFAGRVGTGFDDRALDHLLRKLNPLVSDICPFTPRPKMSATSAWVRAELVATVRYLERTRDGILRAPIFVGLRPDKAPRDARLVEVPESSAV